MKVAYKQRSATRVMSTARRKISPEADPRRAARQHKDGCAAQLHLLLDVPHLPIQTLSRAAMDLMRAGETMLRSSQPLIPSLAPAAYRQPARRVAFVHRHCRAQAVQSTASRSFSTSMRVRQDDNAASNPTASPEGSSTPRKPSNEIGDILNDVLSGNKGTPTAPTGRNTRYASNRVQHQNSPSRATAFARKQESNSSNSFEDLLGGIGVSGTPQGRSKMRGRRDVRGSLNPTASSGPLPAPPPSPLKLNPNLGRTVYVNNARGVDVAGAFNMLGAQVARNRVRTDFYRQKFHERGGVKRKRLHSERWRKRFKLGFQALVKRVLKMKKQGW